MLRMQECTVQWLLDGLQMLASVRAGQGWELLPVEDVRDGDAQQEANGHILPMMPVVLRSTHIPCHIRHLQSPARICP